MSGLSIAKFGEIYKAETGFDLMDRDGRSIAEHARHNIQWFRDWANETAQRLDREAERLREPRALRGILPGNSRGRRRLR